MGMRSRRHSVDGRFRRFGAVVVTAGLVSAAAVGSVLVAGPAGADPTSVPNQPIVTQVFDGSGSSALPVSLGVAFVVPTSPPGGDPITSETATCASLTGGPSGSATGLGSPIFVGALAATGVYDCTVTATNSLGTSPPSAPFFVFLGGQGTCTELPTAPGRLSTAPGDASATVSWAPATGPCIAGYVVTPYLAGVAQTSTIIPGQGTTTVVPNLVNGVTYTFTVAAENGISVGPASAATAPITVGAASAVAAVRVTKVAKGTLRIAFNAPANNGAPVTNYAARCTSSNHGAPGVKSGASGPLTVSRLAAGKTYTCTVTATNSRGPGPASPKSRPVTV
jgi:Fibronectin type III domain